MNNYESTLSSSTFDANLRDTVHLDGLSIEKEYLLFWSNRQNKFHVSKAYLEEILSYEYRFLLSGHRMFSCYFGHPTKYNKTWFCKELI